MYRARARNSQRDGPMTVDSNQDGRPNYYPNSFMGPVDSAKWKQHPIQVLRMEIDALLVLICKIIVANIVLS